MTRVDAAGLISQSINADVPRSFFVYAGAGSGKTAQLVTALETATNRWGADLRARDSRLCVITYTNAAANEIRVRLGHDPLVDVSTVHSFAWTLIKPFTRDIAKWLRTRLLEDLTELEADEAKGRPGTQASDRRLRDMKSKKLRLETLDAVRRFNYSPSQASAGVDGLAHAEVLRAAAEMLSEKPLLQELLVGRYPFLFIDEVQDTNKALMEALLALQVARPNRFCVGLFGDTMQRIYMDGKRELEDAVGTDWNRPALDVNFRSSQRVVRLVNAIRAGADGRQQVAHSSAAGLVRLFIADEDGGGQPMVEDAVRDHMAVATGDAGWRSPQLVKTLILEHALAAVRHGFTEFYQAFEGDKELRRRVFSRDAAGSGIVAFLGTQLLPLIEAITAEDTPSTEALLRKHSPLLNSEQEARDPSARAQLVTGVRRAVDRLREVAEKGEVPILSLIEAVHDSGLLHVPEMLRHIIENAEPGPGDAEDDSADPDTSLEGWRRAVAVDVQQVTRFYEYIVGEAPFDTHQGVKGLEFPRVMVVLDDKAAGGFLFSYGKIFGSTALSGTDRRNAAAGQETASDRTLRLFYVICSRAEDSLAVVLYTSDPDAARSEALARDWFDETEILLPEDLPVGTRP